MVSLGSNPGMSHQLGWVIINRITCILTLPTMITCTYCPAPLKPRHYGAIEVFYYYYYYYGQPHTALQNLSTYLADFSIHRTKCALDSVYSVLSDTGHLPTTNLANAPSHNKRCRDLH